MSSKIANCANKICNCFKSHFLTPGSFFTSIGAGLLTGGILGVGVLAGRGIYIGLADTDYLLWSSRQRYLDKQRIFEASVERDIKFSDTANRIVGEYDLVATRMPFAQIDDKYRF